MPPRGDHPRSRGVYFDGPQCSSLLPGSSPLARGLRPYRQRHHGRRGIIPARAGFTRAGESNPRFDRDHPRSRGVYVRPALVIRMALGSSPLARGLPGDREGEDGLAGIIPARGGLPRPPHGGGRSAGIIPARAGFTTAAPSSWAPSTDHPRSRGVYRDPLAEPVLKDGSSPLARGLLHEGAAVNPRAGIIPARAGFTVARAVAVIVFPDHPRSRGVYPRTRAAHTVPHRSSPLARGLHYPHADMMEYLGIIPARAGFTPPS